MPPASNPRPVSSLEMLFIIVGLLLMLGALTGLFYPIGPGAGGAGSTTAGTRSFQVFSGTIYLIASIFIVRRLDVLWFWLSSNKVLFALLALIIVSSVWSNEPWVTFRRGVALVGTSVFAAYLVLRLQPEQMMRALAWACLIAIGASALAVVMSPEVGIHRGDAHHGLWRGIFGHKNLFGRMMALAALLFFLLRRSNVLPASLCWLGLVAALFGVAMSQSMTALVALVVAFVAILPFKILRDADPRMVTLYAFVFLVIGLTSVYLSYHVLEHVLGLIGRDVTLSGRSRIWELAVEAASERPLIGYGYRSFWTEQNAGWLYALFSWDAAFGHSHNSYLDMWLDVGLLGLGLFAAAVIQASRRILRYLAEVSGPSALWFPVSLCFILVTGITERTIGDHATIEWVLFVSTLLYLSRYQYSAAEPGEIRVSPSLDVSERPGIIASTEGGATAAAQVASRSRPDAE